ncbi:MAG: HAMP domain-containing sensor histidine kinase [Chloroflexi bacterium]|nr:HAMP domain-containing sensor histidine kinase [Chloroflexota bacterium]
MTLSRTYIDNSGQVTEVAVDQLAMVEENSLHAEQLVQTEQFSAIGKMAASIVHDFKGPLTVIRGCAELLANPEITAEKRERYTNMILEDVDRFLAMSQDLLEYSRGAVNLDCQPVKVGAWLGSLADYIRDTACTGGVRLDTRFNFTGEVKMDEYRVRRAIMNLVANAVDAMPEGGNLTIASEVAGATWQLSVSDTGCGIPIEVRSRVLEPFVTKGKANGTGLGLATVCEIVQGHGGRLDFETWTAEEANGSGSGTTFVIELPVERPLA